MGHRQKLITAADMEKMTPQQRADAVESARAKSWDDVPERFRAEVLATASELGEQRRRQRA
jgi:acyl-CoA reductase-like NAD-dependent aldehyde dehydrogenase